MGNRKNRAKQSFLLYHDSRDLFAKLSPEDCQTLILDLFDYSMEQDVFFPPGSAVDIAFTVIRTYMDKNALKYEERCRINRQNGAKGGAPRGNKNAEKKPKPDTPAVAFTEEEKQLCRTIARNFNRICEGRFSRVKVVTDNRKSRILAVVRSIERSQQDPLATLEQVFMKMISSEFLSPSSNNPTWRANFDWLFKNPDTWIKILEGQYDELFIKGRR
ncbi:DUF6291 domain-containing protein [Alistipes timonensis]|uniref:DUF6291 domain-containing protein n=1 Tax=Alistipes timonensis TaxID=1465754 RepID=UPI000E88A912|nr:DUF6291 domain-containing protein [Alistipes timonensis]MCR2031906.1 DUF6291 domain-containing protein [Alistipes timonensis]HBA32342.1 hypothetical protein [Parabacteroides goldsteinii]